MTQFLKQSYKEGRWFFQRNKKPNAESHRVPAYWDYVQVIEKKGIQMEPSDSLKQGYFAVSTLSLGERTAMQDYRWISK